MQIDRFSKAIEFRDGHYHVALPWRDELISWVKSNSFIALYVLNRVNDKLSKTGLLEKYLDVFSATAG